MIFIKSILQTRRDTVCQSLNIETPETNYADILQRLVRRYLFKLERQKEEGIIKANFVFTENYFLCSECQSRQLMIAKTCIFVKLFLVCYKIYKIKNFFCTIHVVTLNNEL